MTKQLNIRSDEAASRARLLAVHLGMTTTEVVVEALRDYSLRKMAPSTKTTTEQAEADFCDLRRMIEEANVNRPAGLTSDHSDLYDDNGLPS